MKYGLIKEFGPTIGFLARFIGIYLVGNLLYGIYVSSFRPHPDLITSTVTAQASGLLNLLGMQTSYLDAPNKSTTYIEVAGKRIIAVYEGCNGVNVMVVFLAFVLAFGPLNKTIAWFIPLGLLIIHFANLVRLIGLFFVSKNFPKYLYFTHKYLFTGAIYLIILCLWLWWVKVYGVKKQS